ncbi:MAG: hypothetical protein HYR86_10290 [Candidatus Rokubacteria bacterium]|nr:hypothetical protein [Candidatus Rokubacteria bacterium]
MMGVRVGTVVLGLALGALAGCAPATAPAMVAVFDPTGQSPQQMAWPPYPAAPPPGYHWQETGSPAIRIDPATRQPVTGPIVNQWILVRDGYTMPQIRGPIPAPR